MRQGRNLALSVEDALSVGAQLAFRPDITVERDGFDAEFCGEFGNRGVAALHGGLGEANLGLGEGELAAAPSPSGTGGFQSREGTLANQFTLEFGIIARFVSRITLRPHKPAARLQRAALAIL